MIGRAQGGIVLEEERGGHLLPNFVKEKGEPSALAGTHNRGSLHLVDLLFLLFLLFLLIFLLVVLTVGGKKKKVKEEKEMRI